MLSGATFYDYINTIYQFIKHSLDNKMSVFRDMEALKFTHCILRKNFYKRNMFSYFTQKGGLGDNLYEM